MQCSPSGGVALMVVRRRRQRGLAPAVVGASALLLVACGASDAISPSVATPTADLARSASGATIPVITPGPSSAASATPAGPVANGPGQVVQGQTAATTVKETDQLKFNPASSTLKAGQVIEWDNSGQIAHNVTFDDFPQLTSDTMNGGDKHQVKFSKAGTYS